MTLDSERQQIAHLLRRFGLGASEAELDHYGRDGLRGAVDRLFDFDSVEEGFATQIEEFRNPQNGQIPQQALVTWWVLRLVQTRRPLQERVTLFWHDHFATSLEKVRNPLIMQMQNDTLRRLGFGSFRKLMTEVSKDPAMILWLDTQFNVRGKPNENFARELLELFTLGVGNYSEADVLEISRAFTGYSVRRAQRAEMEAGRPPAEFLFRAALHDRGQKSFLESSGPFGGDDVIDVLCSLPRTSEFLVGKLWESFAYPDPEPALVARLAGEFRTSSLDVKSILKRIALSSEFYSPKALRAIYKSPVDFCVATLRQMGVGEALTRQIANAGQTPIRGRLGPVNAASQTMRNMGMWLFHPPDVSGWDGGASWISSATMLERIGWADRMFAGTAGGRAGMRLPVFDLIRSDPTPRGVATRMASIFNAPVPEEKFPALVAAATKAMEGRLTPQNSVAAAGAVSKLIFASPEFQFC
jgi:uncharacterized protein (DUF1800 family)